MAKCYYDGAPCDCGAFDVAGDCPRDDFVHDDDEFVDEDMIDDAYQMLTMKRSNTDEEINRF